MLAPGAVTCAREARAGRGRGEQDAGRADQAPRGALGAREGRQRGQHAEPHHQREQGDRGPGRPPPPRAAGRGPRPRPRRVRRRRSRPRRRRRRGARAGGRRRRSARPVRPLRPPRASAQHARSGVQATPRRAYQRRTSMSRAQLTRAGTGGEIRSSLGPVVIAAGDGEQTDHDDDGEESAEPRRAGGRVVPDRGQRGGGAEAQEVQEVEVDVARVQRGRAVRVGAGVERRPHRPQPEDRVAGVDGVLGEHVDDHQERPRRRRSAPGNRSQRPTRTPSRPPPRQATGPRAMRIAHTCEVRHRAEPPLLGRHAVRRATRTSWAASTTVAAAAGTSARQRRAPACGGLRRRGRPSSASAAASVLRVCRESSDEAGEPDEERGGDRPGQLVADG